MSQVGEIVHYVSRGSADGVFDSECRVGIVTREGAGDGLLDLFVITPNGTFHDLNLKHDPTPLGGTWHTLEECEVEET